MSLSVCAPTQYACYARQQTSLLFYQQSISKQQKLSHLSCISASSQLPCHHVVTLPITCTVCCDPRIWMLLQHVSLPLRQQCFYSAHSLDTLVCVMSGYGGQTADPCAPVPCRSTKQCMSGLIPPGGSTSTPSVISSTTLCIRKQLLPMGLD